MTWLSSLNVIITGCASDLGQCLSKILLEHKTNTIGIDIHDNHCVKSIYKQYIKGIPASHPDYIEFILKACKSNSINLLIPASEAEIEVINNYRELFANIGTKLLLANSEAIEIGLDKYFTYQFLRKHKLPRPWTRLIDQKEPKEIPCIAKPRSSQGSKKIYLVDDNLLVQYCKKKLKDGIWQELLGNHNAEYTCGIFRQDNITRSISFRRNLIGGMTNYAKSVHDLEIENLCHSIAQKIGLIGSINIQLRYTNRGPVLFEINPRLSGTALYRHSIGFKDFIWSIEALFKQPISPYVKPTPGIKICRELNNLSLEYPT